MTRLFRQHDRAHLRNVTRTFRTIDRKRRRAAGAHQTRHFDDRADAATRARATHRSVAKSLDETGDVLAIETARRHHNDASFAPPVSREKNAIVPKDVDRKSATLYNFFVIFPTDDFEPCGEADEIDGTVENEIRGANQQTIFERILREVGELVCTVAALHKRQSIS